MPPARELRMADDEVIDELVEKRRVLTYMKSGGGMPIKTVTDLCADHLRRLSKVNTCGGSHSSYVYDCNLNDVVVLIGDCFKDVEDDVERTRLQTVLRNRFRSFNCACRVEFFLIPALYFYGRMADLVDAEIIRVTDRLQSIEDDLVQHRRYIQRKQDAHSTEIENDKNPSVPTWKRDALVSILGCGGRDSSPESSYVIGAVTNLVTAGDVDDNGLGGEDRSMIVFDEKFRKRVGVRGNGDRKALGILISSLLTHVGDCAQQLVLTMDEFVFRGVVDGAASIRRCKQLVFLSSYGRQLFLFETTKRLKSLPSYVDDSVDPSLFVGQPPPSPCMLHGDFPVPYPIALADLMLHIAQMDVGHSSDPPTSSARFGGSDGVVAMGVPVVDGVPSSSKSIAANSTNKKARVDVHVELRPDLMLPSASSTYLHRRDKDCCESNINTHTSVATYPVDVEQKQIDIARAYWDVYRQRKCHGVHSCSFDELKRTPPFASVLKHAVNLAFDSVRVGGWYQEIGSSESRAWLANWLMLPTSAQDEDAAKKRLVLPTDFAMDDDQLTGSFTFNNCRYSIECLESVDMQSSYIGVFAAMGNFDLICPTNGFAAIRIRHVDDDVDINASIARVDAAFATNSSAMRQVMHCAYESLVVSSLHNLPMTPSALCAMDRRGDITFHNDPRMHMERIRETAGKDVENDSNSSLYMGVPLPCTSMVPLSERIVPMFSPTGFRPESIFGDYGEYAYNSVYGNTVSAAMDVDTYMECTGKSLPISTYSIVGDGDKKQFSELIFGVLFTLFRPRLTARAHELLYKHAVANSYGPKIRHRLDSTTHVKSMFYNKVEYDRLVVLADLVCGRRVRGPVGEVMLGSDIQTRHTGTIVKRVMDNFSDHVVRARSMSGAPPMAKNWVCQWAFLVDAAALICFLVGNAPRVPPVDPIKRLLHLCISDDYNGNGRVITKAMPAHRMYDGLEKLLRRLCEARKIKTVMHNRQRHFHIV